jgi:hypothetical protein
MRRIAGAIRSGVCLQTAIFRGGDAMALVSAVTGKRAWTATDLPQPLCALAEL